MSEHHRIDSFCVALIDKGMPYDSILIEVRKKFPHAKTTKRCLYWYKSKMNRGLFAIETTAHGALLKKIKSPGRLSSSFDRVVESGWTPIPDGLAEIRDDLPVVIEMIARTARWVHPDTFRALPLWYPETARGRPLFTPSWNAIYSIKNQVTKLVSEGRESNQKAGKALVAALGVKKTTNRTVCHIWGTDDPKFQKSNRVVRDPRYYTCVGNMISLPTPLKGFADSVPEIKEMLRICAFHLYHWTCEHGDVLAEAGAVRDAGLPPHYPEHSPHAELRRLPRGTMPFSNRVRAAIDKRKDELRRLLCDTTLTRFPKDEVRNVLDFWKIAL
jgi:hypothetical protein